VQPSENKEQLLCMRAARKLLSSSSVCRQSIFHRSNVSGYLKQQHGVAVVVFAAFLSSLFGGCLSNEYVIPKTELARLAQLPPEQRGQRVKVVQTVGDRRSEAIDGTRPPPSAVDDGQGYGPPPEGYIEAAPESQVGVGLVIVPVPIGSTGGGPRAAPGPRGPAPGRAAPSRPRSSSSGGNLGNVKGGGGNNDVAALLIIVAVLATIGMVATEGVRYDGSVAMYPWQSVHLKDGKGQEREVPLAQLTPADVASAANTVVMDDEGWGLQRLERRPLDRKGFTFKMDMGELFSSGNTLSASGFGANIQFGYFPHHRFGLLGTWAFSAGSDTNSQSYYRNNLALEAQFFPLRAWRLHLGGFGHGGVQYANDAKGGTRSGTALGGGLILEIALTSRLALTARADYTSARVAPGGGWAGTEMFTLGVAIY
jgi:hypothetical protein